MSFSSPLLFLAVGCLASLSFSYSQSTAAADQKPAPVPAAPPSRADTLLFNPSWQQGLSSAAGLTPDYWTGMNVTLGKYIFPHFHANGVLGSSTAADVGSLSVGHHDPQRDGFTYQGFELGTSVRVGDLEGFVAYHLGYEHEAGEWEDEWEEAFAKWKNLGQFELRGGKYLNRFGLQNTLHLHGWDWADQYLVSGRFLGEDGLTSIGGELNYYLPVQWTSLLTFSVGEAPEESHEHEEEEEGEETLFEGEGAEARDLVLAGNWTNQANYNDFHQFRFGLSGAITDNGWERRNGIYAAHFEYQWREEGYALTGRYLRWRTEVMARRLGAVSGHLPGEEEHEEEHGEEEEGPAVRDTLSEWGGYTDLRYGWSAEGWQLGLRAEHVSGISEAGLPGRTRISPGVAYFLNPQRTVFLRVQYNYDRIASAGDEHSIWAQFGINWGGPEVR
jgi:hypothetical protein